MDITRIAETMAGQHTKTLADEFREKVERCEADGGHVFEIVHAPPYRCTFCGLSHAETDGGKFIRSTDK